MLRRPNRSWNAGHGTWAYQLELPVTPEGRRRQLRRGGLTSRAEAFRELEHARAALALAGRDRTARSQVADLLQRTIRSASPLPELADLGRRLHRGSPLTDVPTVAEWLAVWASRLKVDPSTARTYESHVRLHLIPCLGEIVLDRLRPHHIDELVDRIEAQNTAIRNARNSTDPAARAGVRGVRPTGQATIARIRATLRKAFNDALAREIVVGVANPASLIKTPNPRPRPVVWEPERVARWRATGHIPSSVMVWTLETTGEFLDFAAAHAPDLHPLLHFMAYRGPRRGEVCGLLDAEVRLDRMEVSIVNQLAVYGGKQTQKAPKSHAGNRDVILDPDTVAVFRSYRARRAAWRLKTGSSWPDTGLFFVHQDGRAWQPPAVSQAFRRLVARAGLPPIRLHDLRHVSATVALAAGVDIKVVSEQLGHSTTTLTRDTYQSVTKSLHHDAANAVAEAFRSGRATSRPQ
ncbi:site-specific integrase [Actinoplanes sp. M2I2]|uniref:tyrosine-type recombinase/integrase n=1 Tax=Actinoplanes sp. M2I2 TaxID=1734444 RepID=UPI00201FCC50|nr:site-specific integrase [Actinoplanes sp. M2I2]